MFVPFCCTGLANIRRYLADGSGTVLAERANEFANVYDAQHRPFSKVRGEYLWIHYGKPARNAAGDLLGIADGNIDVTAIKRYSLDLEQEETFSCDVAYPTGTNVGSESFIYAPAFDEFDVIDGVAPVAVVGHQSATFGVGTYLLRCWNADGSIRWTVTSPVAALAYGRILSTAATDAGVWMLWQQAVPGGITPPDPNDPNPPPPQPTEYTVEVYADLRNKTTGALVTRLSLQALHTTLSMLGDAPTFNDKKWFSLCEAGQGRIAVVSDVTYLASTDSVAGPNHRRAAIVEANAGSYSWFRLRRPSTGGATTAVAGYEPFRPAGSLGTVTFCVVPQSTKGLTAHGLWVHAYDVSPQFFEQGQHVIWQWTLDGNYASEYLTPTVIDAPQPGQTADTIWKVVYRSSVLGQAVATNVDYDDNGALMYVREWNRQKYGSTFDVIYRGFGTVLKVRNNATEQWESPFYTVLSDVIAPEIINPGLPTISDPYDLAKVTGERISIANDRPNDSGTYYLVGAGAF